MRDSAETMAENVSAPPPFKLEREVTLMPNEFRERLSAKHKSRKSSAGRSAIRQSESSKPSTGRLRYSTENTYTSNYRQDSGVNQSPLASYRQDSEVNQSPMSEAKYVKSVKIFKEPHEDKISSHNTFSSDTNNNQGELKSTSCHIELTGDVKFMLDNAYANHESEGDFTVKTPPKNMQIKDIMIPLDDWNNKDTIQEKKYTVLPSIQHKKSVSSEDSESVTFSNRNSSGFSINNQLDFFRDKIEQDADFFADFRVNTSTVKPTPRQDPLPPIKHATKDNKHKSPRANKKTHLSSKDFFERRDKNGHLY